IDANRELQAAGVANLAAGLVGGMVGFHSLSLSSLTIKLGVRSRLIGVVSGAVCALTLVGGVALLSYLPRPGLGGVLFFVGLLFFVEWVYEGWFRLSRPDYVVMIVILGVIGTVDYIPGIGVGIIAAVIMFVVNYSRVDVVKHVLSGANHQSNVERPPPQHRLLREHGEQVYILQLQGFIFFGTAHNLLTQVTLRTESEQLPPLRFLVLDFRRVSGLDSSAVLSFVRMRRLAQRRGFTVLVTHVSPPISHQLTVSRLADDSPGAFRVFPDLDHGIEWCEERILHDAHLPVDRKRWTLADLQPAGTDAVGVDQISKYLERICLS